MAGGASAGSQTEHVTDTRFWDELMHDVFGPRQGGAIIFLDAENARKGVAKTSGAVALARLLSQAFGYDLKQEDMTLSGAEYLQRYQDHPGHDQPSVLVLDEFVGAGAGDKRRSMAKQNVDFGRAWQLLRTKRVVTIATLPDWNEADKRLKKLADYRIWCRERPIGAFQPYKVVVPFNSSSGAVHTQGLNDRASSAQRVMFPNMDAHSDPYYKHLSQKKDELIHSSTWDADELAGEGSDGEENLTAEEMKKRQTIRYAIRLYEPWDDDNNNSYRDVAKVIGDYSREWVGNVIRDWRDGDYRNLVEDPTNEGDQ